MVDIENGNHSTNGHTMSETTPLLNNNNNANGNNGDASPPGWRESMFAFLEAQTPLGRIYEIFMIVLILLNVAAFVLASLFVPEYNDAPWAQRETGICGNFCDALWFGNFPDNSLQWMNIGSTSVLELVTIVVFSIEYLLRLYLADLEDPKYKGIWGRIKWVPTFFSMIDLVSTVPFFVDAFFLKNTDLVVRSKQQWDQYLQYDYFRVALTVHKLTTLLFNFYTGHKLCQNVSSLSHDACGRTL